MAWFIFNLIYSSLNSFSCSYALYFGFSFFQGNPILGVHIFLYSKDVSEIKCLQGSANGPRQEVALCHAVSDADGKFTFNSIPCGNFILKDYSLFSPLLKHKMCRRGC